MTGAGGAEDPQWNIPTAQIITGFLTVKQWSGQRTFKVGGIKQGTQSTEGNDQKGK